MLCAMLSCSVMSNSLQPRGMYPARLLCPWVSPGKNTEVGCHALLKGIFPTQRQKLHFPWLLHCRPFLYHWDNGEAQWYYESKSEVTQSCPTLCNPVDCSLPGSSIHGIFQGRILEWIAIPFSRRSSQPREWTQVSRIVGRCFIVWPSGKSLIL